jgi:hypothetical protein
VNAFDQHAFAPIAFENHFDDGFTPPPAFLELPPAAMPEIVDADFALAPECDHVLYDGENGELRLSELADFADSTRKGISHFIYYAEPDRVAHYRKYFRDASDIAVLAYERGVFKYCPDCGVQISEIHEIKASGEKS